MKTKTLKISEIEKEWWIADAESQILGRLASKVAQIIRGKHKVNFVPHMDNGDCVVVVNAEKVMVTGNKEEDKSYFRHTGYVGGVKMTSLAHLRRTYPERIIEKAVKGMLPKNKKGDKSLSKRDFSRVIKPLNKFGLSFKLSKNNLPLKFRGTNAPSGALFGVSNSITPSPLLISLSPNTDCFNSNHLCSLHSSLLEQ